MEAIGDRMVDDPRGTFRPGGLAVHPGSGRSTRPEARIAPALAVNAEIPNRIDSAPRLADLEMALRRLDVPGPADPRDRLAPADLLSARHPDTLVLHVSRHLAIGPPA